MTKLFTTAAALALLVGAAQPADAATARCGMLLTSKATLTRDLDCTGTRPIRLQGPKAHLNLNGFELTCGTDDTRNPLRLKGRGTLLRNGVLRDCSVELLDQGDHKLRFLTIENFAGPGITIWSPSNEITNNAVQSDANGIGHAAGNFNLIGDNDIFGAGAALILGNRTYVVNNRLESGGGGVQVNGNFNRVVFNEVVDTCIEDAGRENLIGGNVIDEELCNPAPEPEPEPEVPAPLPETPLPELEPAPAE